MINGESYKVIVAESGLDNAIGMDNIYERVFIVKLLTDKNNSNRVCGAVGFSVREVQDLRLQVQGCDHRLRRRGQRLPAPVGG